MSPFSSVNVAMLAAHGLTQRVVATWNPGLPRDPRVMVPVVVDALAVRKTGASWANTLMKRTPQAANASPTPAKDLLPKPFTLRDQERSPGVYLHWALPEALTRGSYAPGSSGSAGLTSFPALPDRWLITRISPSAVHPDRRAVRGWILQAHDDNPQPIDLDSWKEPGAPPAGLKNPLTALGYGDLSWAGFFDNTQNRLAFYDDLKDVASGPVAYMVCGWYSDPALDPLGPATVRSLADFYARMQELGWALPAGDLEQARSLAGSRVFAAQSVGLPVTAVRAHPLLNQFTDVSVVGAAGVASTFDPQSGTYSTDGSWWPQMSILHGAVVGIGWPGVGWEGNPTGMWNPQAVNRNVADPAVTDPVGGPPDPSSIKVAIGNTVTEAMAKLVAVDQSRADEARILEAFQLNALETMNEPDGAARVDSLLHAKAFGSLPGGYVTETIWQPPTSINQAPPSNPPAPDAGVFGRYQHTSTGVTAGLRGPAVLPATRTTRVNTPPARTAEFLNQVQLISGNLSQVAEQHLTAPEPPPRPGEWIEVKRALPRFFHPADPILLIAGGKATFKHKPGSFSKDGLLYCRLTGDSATQVSCQQPASAGGAVIGRASVTGSELLERGVENGSVPPECEDLLCELVVLDPGSSLAAARTAAGPHASAAAVEALARNFVVEQTAWQATRDPRVDHAPLISLCGITGRLPSPIAVSLPAHPWNPIRLDWRVEYLPSAGGTDDWQLDEIDYQLKTFHPAPPVVFENSSLLTQASNTIVAAAIRKALEHAAAAGGSGITQPGTPVAFISAFAETAVKRFQQIALSPAAAVPDVPSLDRLPLDDIASALSDMDLLTAGLDGFITLLRGGFAGDGAAKPGSSDSVPNPFFQIRSGFVRFTRLRLIDGFGQFVELLQTPPAVTADSKLLIKSDPMIVPDQADVVALPPRFTSPARISFRLVDGGGSGKEANLDLKTGNTISPVCGYLMPNHLDGAIEFFDIDGGNLGFIRPQDDKTTAWAEAPGKPSTLGQDPSRAISNPFAAGIATGLVRWGAADAGLATEKDTALQALLRVIDSTLWSIDPFGHAGDEHLSLLVGHPVVVLRAQLRLELQEPIHTDLANLIAVPVRLGALAHWEDGLLGYFVNDDYTSLHCADAAAAGLARLIGPNQGFLQAINLVPEHFTNFIADTGKTPVNHTYVDTSGLVWVRPNQDVNLTLLVEPYTVVHATCGLLPRKEIGMRREWIAPALAKLSPTFRFGPLLVDPKRIRMPIPRDIQGTWSWDYRADANTWVELPITDATQDALLPLDPPSGTEGWMRLTPSKEKSS